MLRITLVNAYCPFLVCPEFIQLIFEGTGIYVTDSKRGGKISLPVGELVQRRKSNDQDAIWWNWSWRPLSLTECRVLLRTHSRPKSKSFFRIFFAYSKVKKGKADIYSSSREPHLRAPGRHLPCGITQCYLPPDTSERAPHNPSHAGWYSIFLPRKDGRLS